MPRDSLSQGQRRASELDLAGETTFLIIYQNLPAAMLEEKTVDQAVMNAAQAWNPN